VLELLEQNSQTTDGHRLYSVVAKDELVRRGGPAEAAFYLEAEPGYMFSGSLSGPGLVRVSSLKGNHGYNPAKPEMHTGFIIAGRGVKPGVVLEKIQLVDIAPTAAALLGLRMEGTDGQVLRPLNHN
jgi:predicted AlkP superfamily pyrophosphatase or phosphodiesterase